MSATSERSPSSRPGSRSSQARAARRIVVPGLLVDHAGREPLLGYQAAWTPPDGGRGAQAATAQHRGEASDQRGEQCAVGPVQAEFGIGPTQYRDLVA